uniref:Cytokine receptor family member b6 n=1 Tax=Nothobranchius pienaari TaxID=704102 RepID=A0A1A8LRG9_9TELE
MFGDINPAAEMDIRTLMSSWTRGGLLNIVVLVLVLVRVGSEEVLVPPTRVHLNGSELKWTPGPVQDDVTYSVFYNNESSVWVPVPECDHTSLLTCHLSGTRSLSECFRLRVRASRFRLESEPVEACSSHGSLCSPEVRLSAGPGSLTVLLSRNHSLFHEHADHAMHVIYFGAEGEELKEQEDASKPFRNLEVGRRFCVTVQFRLHGKAFGPASCKQCEVIPERIPGGPEQKMIIPTVVLVVLLVSLGVWLAYVFIYRYKWIKRILQPPYTIPDFFQEPISERTVPILCPSPLEERYDVVLSVTPRELGGD